MNTIEEVTIYKNLELSLRREVWRLDLSPLHISLGRMFPTVTVTVGTPNLCIWNLKLPDVGACVRWLATGMSTRLRTIQCRMVTRAFARWPSRGSQPIRSSIAEKHYWYSRLLPGLSPLCGSFLGAWRKLCWRKAQAWACGYHDVFVWRDTPVYM